MFMNFKLLEAFIDGHLTHPTNRLNIGLTDGQFTNLRHKIHNPRRRRLGGIVTYNVVGLHLLRDELGQESELIRDIESATVTVNERTRGGGP